MCTTTNFGPGEREDMAWKATGGSTVSNEVHKWSRRRTMTDGTNVALDLVGTPTADGLVRRRKSSGCTSSATPPPAALLRGAKGFTFTTGRSTFNITSPNPHNLPIKHVLVFMQENRSADHTSAS